MKLLGNHNRERGLDTRFLVSIDFDDFTSPFTPQFLFRLIMRRYIIHSRQCFIGYPNTSNFVKNTPLRVVFSTLFSVFGYPDETLSLAFDTLHKPLVIRFHHKVYAAPFIAQSLSRQNLFLSNCRKPLIQSVQDK